MKQNIPTYKENAQLIRDNLSIRTFLESCTTVRGNRAICPVCNNPKFTMALNDNTQLATCFTGCTKGVNPKYPEKQTADVIDLYTLVNKVNNIEALNQLIKDFNIKRYTGNYNPSSKKRINIEFKNKAKTHLEELDEKLYALRLLKYEKLVELGKYEYCVNLSNRINSFLEQLKVNNFKEETGRNLYKEGASFHKYIESITY